MKELAPWAAVILAIILTIWNSGRWVGEVESQRKWRADIERDVAKINGLPEWKRRSEEERAALGQDIENLATVLRATINQDHEKHKTEEAKIRAEMLALVAAVEHRLSRDQERQWEVCRERFVRLERKVD